MKVGQRGGMEEAGEANTEEKAADWRAVSQSTHKPSGSMAK